jgi:hypothetical protein
MLDKIEILRLRSDSTNLFSAGTASPPIPKPDVKTPPRTRSLKLTASLFFNIFLSKTFSIFSAQ